MSEMVPEYGGCVWPVDPACETEEWLEIEGPLQDRSLALASETLRRLSGYRVGGCPITVRPCQQRGTWACWETLYGPGGSFEPMNWGGTWLNTGCTTCATPCEVPLPRPVGEVMEVKVDGAVIDPSDYAVQDQHFLVWMGAGDCPWPRNQNLSLPDSDPGTFSVTYLNAQPVDALGAYAVGVLALEFAKACTNKKCRLPTNVTELVRLGATYSLVPGSFPNGVTGIREVDAWVELWNPNHLKMPSRILNPAHRSPRIV